MLGAKNYKIKDYGKQFENTATISVKEYDFLRDIRDKNEKTYLKEATLIDVPRGYFTEFGYHNHDYHIYSKDKAIIELAKRLENLAEQLKEEKRITFELKRSTSRRFRRWRKTDKI